MKRLFAFLVAAVMVLTNCVVPVAAERTVQCGDDCYSLEERLISYGVLDLLLEALDMESFEEMMEYASETGRLDINEILGYEFEYNVQRDCPPSSLLCCIGMKIVIVMWLTPLKSGGSRVGWVEFCSDYYCAIARGVTDAYHNCFCSEANLSMLSYHLVH